MAGTVTEGTRPSQRARPLHVGLSLLTLFPGRVGGTETAVRELLRQFGSGNGPERITVLANRHVASAYADFEQGPVHLHHVRSYRPGNSIPTRALAMATARLAPAIVERDVPGGIEVLHHAVTVPIPRFRGPTVLTIFDVQHLDLPAFFSRGERLFRRWAYEGAARRATVVVTGSEYSKRRLAESAGVDADRIEVVPLGIDHERFQPNPREGEDVLLQGLGLPERFVVYPANLWRHKNHLRLLDALALTSDRKLGLVLTGQPYDRLEEVTAHARRLGLGERVHHLGYVDRELVPALYRAAVGMVFPSLYEGFGAPPLEAMGCGCPVAASDIGSLRELCGTAALSFDPESPDEVAAAIDRLASDPQLRATLRKAGIERARRFDWALAASRHREIYERAAATF
jgi:glycosyltransferase involved in cell wall biosynthesis